MTDLNAQAQDEISLDDLFSQIDDITSEAEQQPQILAEPTIESAAAEPALDELDELDLLLGGDSESQALIVDEPAAPVEQSADTAESDLDGLFDESELDLDALSLEPEVEQPKVEEKSAPKAKKQKAEPTPAETTEPKAEPKEKSPTTYRTTYQNSKRSAVLLDRLGGDTSEIVLEFDDVDLPAEQLKEKQQQFLRLLNNQPTLTAGGQTVQKKVAEKVVILFTMFKRGGKWNEVMYRTFSLLLTDGYIQSGDNGNLVQNLKSKPYSPATARAQAGQMMQLLPLLKIANEDGKGRLVPNENSTILMRLRSQFFADLKPAESDAE